MSLCERNIDCLECQARGMCNSYALFKYQQGRTDAINECTEAYFDAIEDVLHEKDLGITLNQALTIYARIMNRCNEKAEELKEQSNDRFNIN